MRTNSVKADRVRCLRLFAVAGLLLLAAVLGGCDVVSQLTGRTFHERFRWKAKDFFHDPQVIALCHAIEANDLKEIDRLVAVGADVNAKGKDNMTPLLWAFPDDKLARFTRLLEHGANPNVIIQSDLNTRGAYFGRGESVTHLACLTKYPGYFEAVFAHGSDPNLLRNKRIKGDTPLHSVIFGLGPNKAEHVRILIDRGAKLDQMNGGWATPVMDAVGKGRYDIALMLLEAGADWRIYVPMSNTRLVHIVAMREDRRQTWTPKQAADYQKLVQRLEDHGESIEQAHVDLKRWQSWPSAEFRRKMDAEIEERIARDGGNTVAAEQGAQDKASAAQE